MLNGNNAFDANVQNLALAEFLLSKNPAQALSRFEKKSVNIAECVRIANSPTSDALDALNHLYLLHNYFFFRNLVQKNLACDDEASRQLKIDF